MTYEVKVDKDGNEIWTCKETGQVDVIAKPMFIVQLMRFIMFLIGGLIMIAIFTIL